MKHQGTLQERKSQYTFQIIHKKQPLLKRIKRGYFLVKLGILFAYPEQHLFHFIHFLRCCHRNHEIIQHRIGCIRRIWQQHQTALIA
jgi:hypothetical protein